jgi:O-antigen ligase
MSPLLALFLTILFIFYLFKRDIGQQDDVSHALWLPWLWMMILGSRYVSEWLTLGYSMELSVDALEDGSPVDRIVFFILIAAALYVLWKRQIPWSLLLHNNVGLTLFICYCAVSILWSDFPFVAFKRLIKVLGHPLMALILLTERTPVKAVETVIQRCAYVLIPMSILFIKYYPDIGRGYDRWEFKPIILGVTHDKNALGYICIVLGLFFACKLLFLLSKNSEPRKMTEKIVTISIFSMILWLLYISNSKTSLVCLVIGVLVTMGLGFPGVKKHLGFYMCISVSILCIFQMTFNIKETIILSLGRDLTLTGRNEIWADVLEMKTDPLFGTGFESFWLGDRLEMLWEKHWWKPNQAHNGYIETYINMGCIGLLFLSGAIFSSFRNIRKTLIPPFNLRKSAKTQFDFGSFRMGFLVALIIYNITEAVFKSLHFLFFIFFVIAIEYPQIKSEMAESNTASLLSNTRKAYNVPQKLDTSLR